MKTKMNRVLTVAICLMLLLSVAQAVEKTKEKILAGVKVVQVEVTVVPNPERIKEQHAPNQVADSLKNSLRYADIQVGEAPIRAHIVLNEFSSGSTAKRVLIGLGAGRSTVDCLLVFTNAEGKELYSKQIRVRGNLMFSPYQGNNTQRRQAVNSLEQRLIEEVEALK
jgi:hypothetical protein